MKKPKYCKIGHDRICVKQLSNPKIGTPCFSGKFTAWQLHQIKLEKK